MYSLVGIDGSAYVVMGYVQRCMREVGMPQEQIQEYGKNARSGDYNNLLCVSIDMIDKCNEALEYE